MTGLKKRVFVFAARKEANDTAKKMRQSTRDGQIIILIVISPRLPKSSLCSYPKKRAITEVIYHRSHIN